MKETKYAGTQTEKNLMAAFAGESEARNKYTYFRFEYLRISFLSWSMLLSAFSAHIITRIRVKNNIFILSDSIRLYPAA